MLPSKGYFSPFLCPFYDSGECLRPYCHYRHCKKDKSDGSGSTNSEENIKDKETNVSRLQEFVSESVNALSQSDLQEDSDVISHTVGSNSKCDSSPEEFSEVPSYKPTPIAELNKRHIPVVYAPTRPACVVRKKEVKESLLYLPKSISRSASSVNAYVPSSTGNATSSTYTYEPSKISNPPFSIKDCKSLLKENLFSTEEEKLKVLDRLVEEEFGSLYNATKSNDEHKEENVNKENSNKTSEASINYLPSKKSSDSITRSPCKSPGCKQDSIVASFDSETQLVGTAKANAIGVSAKETDKLTKKEIGFHSSTNTHDYKNISQKSLGSKHHSSSKQPKETSSTVDDKSKNDFKKTDTKKHKSSSHKSKEKKQESKNESHSSEKRRKRSKEKEHLRDKEHSKEKENAREKEHYSRSKAKHLSSGTVGRSSKSNCESVSKNTTDSKEKGTLKKEEYARNKTTSSNKHEDSKSKHSKHDINSKYKSSVSSNHIKSKLSSNQDEEKSKNNLPKDRTLVGENCHKQSSKQMDTSLEAIKNDSHERSCFKKCRKRDKHEEEKKKFPKDQDKETSPPPPKIKKVEQFSDGELYHDEMESEKLSSSSSDVEEIIVNGETIVIDSSSNSSGSNYVPGDLNLSGASSPSNSPSPSPPPIKKSRLVDEEKFAPSLPGFQSILCERWRKARETVLMKSSAPGKIKISQVPNVKNLLTAKDQLFAKAKVVESSPSPSNQSKTAAPYEEYIPRPHIRVARLPKESMVHYPTVRMDENLKVPVSIRQSCLNNIYDEFKKYLNPEEASQRSIEKEFEICQRTKVTMTYQNACALAVLRIRKNKGKESGEISETKPKHTLHSDTVPDFTHGWSLYRCFEKYIMTKQELVAHGFPMPLTDGCGYIEKSSRRYSVKQPDDESMRVCVNCSKNYFVDEAGFPIEEYNCFFHPGKTIRVRGKTGFTEQYYCCGADAGSEPCTNNRYHLCSTYDEDCLEGFVKTLPLSSNKSIESAGIYALDCEMIYTTKGLDLARCTLVSLEGHVIYDKFVMPDYPILDYNTRFSGLTEETVNKYAKSRLKDVQRDLLKMINEKTIIVGHSLENDFKALRIFHDTVVDTSVVFPHHKGLPYKRALRNVAKDTLNINIQEKESGHDPEEDANTCMQLMLWRIKEDAKGRKPRVIISLDSKGSQAIR